MTTPINKILTNHKQTLSNTELANVSASLSAILGQGGGGGGEPCASAWLPSVSDAGVISWTLTTATTEPTTANIKGPSGDRGPAGTSGAKGEPGDDGYSPTVTLTPITAGDQTGTEVEFTYGAGGSQTTAYTAWNGKDGTGATDYFTSATISGDGTQALPYGVDTTAMMNLTHASALSSTSAFWAVKAKYGENREFEIGKNLYDLNQWQTAIVNWTDSFAGDRGVEVLDVDEDGYPEVFQLDDEAWGAVSSVSAKSNVNITSAGVTTVTNTSGTTINKFTQYGEVANHPTPKMFLCATSDTQSDIVGVLTAASGMGAIVFVVQSIYSNS